MTSRRSERRLIAVLAVTQTVGYGVLYYAFSVLLTPIAADLHAATAAVTGALTTSILVAAVAAVPVGRWMDRRGGRASMTAGSMLGVAAIVGWSQVQELWQLYAVFVLVGLAGAMSLYEAAFAVIVATSEPARRMQGLLAVTIVAGFASSIFFPLTGWLVRLVDWRMAVLVLAALLAVTTIPGHLLAVPGRVRFHAVRAHHAGVSVRDALLDATFWLYAVAFVVHAAAVATVAVLLVAYLQHRGHPATVAATVAGLLGVLSVAGRLLTSTLALRYNMVAVTAAVLGIQALGAAALPVLGGSVLGAAVCVTAFGLGFGVATIARPVILADRYGTTRYATIAASMTTPMTVAKATTPLAAAGLTPDSYLYAVAGACLIAALLLAAACLLAARTPPAWTKVRA